MKCSGSVRCIATFLVLVQFSRCREPAAVPMKVCNGTNFKSIYQESSPDYRTLKEMFSGCTYIEGNLQLFNINSKNMDGDLELTFVNDIQVISGYLLLHNINLTSARFPSLQLIRGNSLFRFNPADPEYAVVVSNLRRHTHGLLQNVEFPALREISRGSVRAATNKPFCSLEKIHWEEILSGEGAHYYYTGDGGCAQTRCDHSCSSGHCWSEGPQNCQQFSKMNCNAKCGVQRCFGGGADECCHSTCAGGCTGPGSSDCFQCRNVLFDGVCLENCPEEMYSLGTTCVNTCPEQFVTDEESKSCLVNCPDDKHEVDGVCVRLPPPAKLCRPYSDFWKGVNSGNIEYFRNCTILNGNLFIDSGVFSTDEHIYGHNLTAEERHSPMRPEQLEVFRTLNTVTGYFAVHYTLQTFRNLSYFRNLEVVGERRALSTFSVYLTSLQVVDFRSLRKVYGNVVIERNRDLCYVDEIDWNAVADGGSLVGTNRAAWLCEYEGNVCSDECLPGGCWGKEPWDCVNTCPNDSYIRERQFCYSCHINCQQCIGPDIEIGSDGCRSCRYQAILFENGTIVCMGQGESCPQGYFLGNVSEEEENPLPGGLPACKRCHPECYQCTGYGAGAEDCQECANYKGGSQCVKECPSDYDVDEEKRECIPIPPSVETTSFTPTSTELSMTTRSSAPKQTVAISVSVGGAVLIIVVAVGAIWYAKRAKNREIQTTKRDSKVISFRAINEKELIMGEILDSGNFGTVYSGMWNPKENYMIPVAIKMSQVVPLQSETAFINEALIMTSVVHPHLQGLLGLCLNSKIMLVTQLMPLGSLKKYLEKNKRDIDSLSMLTWCTQIAQGMEYLESRRLVHRDLAVRNVLLETPLHVKITDFGLAKLLQINEDEYRSRVEMLPVKWLALECLRRGIFSHKSDVWAFGVTVWEILTYGMEPFEDVSPQNVESALSFGHRLQQPPTCTSDLYNTLLTTWLEDPEDRPTFTKLVEDFKNMSRAPKQFIFIVGDGSMRLPRYTSKDEQELIRGFTSKICSPTYVEIMSAKEYFERSGDYYISISKEEESGSLSSSEYSRSSTRKLAANC